MTAPANRHPLIALTLAVMLAMTGCISSNDPAEVERLTTQVAVLEVTPQTSRTTLVLATSSTLPYGVAERRAISEALIAATAPEFTSRHRHQDWQPHPPTYHRVERQFTDLADLLDSTCPKAADAARTAASSIASAIEAVLKDPDAPLRHRLLRALPWIGNDVLTNLEDAALWCYP